MKIEHVRIDAFGTLNGFDTGPETLGQLVVVLGPNEAGKSTLFSFLTTALYGFQPASRERNPHVPWGSDEAGGAVRLKTSDADCVMVERRLRSAPSGSLIRGETTTSIRNQPLPWVDHIPRPVFRQVFAVTLAELAGLDDDTWARIQDRVLGSMGASDLRSARDVADILEREAGEIWRPNRRGNQRLRAVQSRGRALRLRRTAALERDRSIRALVEEKESVEQRLRDVRSEMQHDRVVVDRMQELLPLKRQLDRVAALREEGGARDELEKLPPDPRKRVFELEETLQQLEREISTHEEDLREPESAIASFDDEARTLLDAREAIASFLAHDPAARERVAREQACSGELRRAEHDLATEAERLLVGPLDDAAGRSLEALSVDLLRDRVERMQRGARAESGSGEGARRQGSAPSDRGSRDPAGVGSGVGPSGGERARGRAGTTDERLLPLALAMAGAAFLAWGVMGGPMVVTILGAAALAAGVTLGLMARSGAARDASPLPTATLPVADPGAVLLAEISTMVESIPLRPDLLAPPGDALVVGLRRLQAAVATRARLTEELRELRRKAEARADDARRLATLLGRPAPSDANGFAAELSVGLREAERARDRAEAASREQARLRRIRDSAAGRLEATEGELVRLRDRVDRIATGASVPAIEEVHRRVEAHRRADRIEEELERVHPDLVDLRARIRAVEENEAAWTIDEVELVERKARIDEATATIEELIGRSRALERDIAHLRDLETVDVVDSELAALNEEEERLVAERDRKWVLAQVIREADRTFREEHQPDLLKRASAYLSRLTDGRYDRMLVDERAGGDLFQLVGPGLPAPVPLARPISTGTLEQAYLSLRLAIVDHLDQDRERLPLFIDEAFVNWDERRRDRGLEVLAEVSATRQVFAFTCHPDMASRLQEHGARLIRLRR